jgi:hypothetical protein
MIHKAKTEELKTEVQQHQTGLTGGYQSDWWGTLVGLVCDDAVWRLRIK